MTVVQNDRYLKSKLPLSEMTVVRTVYFYQTLKSDKTGFCFRKTHSVKFPREDPSEVPKNEFFKTY